MSRLARHLFWLVGAAIGFVLVALLGLDSLVALVSESTEMQADYGLPQVLFYILLKLPASAGEYAGFAALIGVMLGVGVLANSGELIALRAAGLSIVRLGWLVLQPALLLIVVVALVTEFVAPRLEQRAESERHLLRHGAAASGGAGFWVFDRGTFVRIGAVGPDGQLFGLERYRVDAANSRLEASRAAVAEYERGQWRERERAWTAVSPAGVEVGSVAVGIWQTGLQPRLLAISALEAGQLSLRDLLRFSRYLGADQRRAREYRLALWQKILAPLATASLALVGLSFVLGSGRRVAVGERIFVGVMACTVIQLLQDIFGPASVVWGFAALWAVLAPIALTLGLGLALLRLRT